MISVLMSVYNETITQIREAIESILNQTYSDIELIVVVDNPNYQAAIDLVDDYIVNEKRITKIVNEKNIGLAMSMNKAASVSSGEYLARMDSDDISELTRLETELYWLNEKNVDFVFSNYCLIDDNSKEINGGASEIKISPKENLLFSILFHSIIHHPTVLFRKSIFEKVEGYRNFPCSQDLDLWFRMLENECKFYMVDQNLLKYRVRIMSVSNSKKFQQQLTIEYIKNLLLQRIKYGQDKYSLDDYNLFLEKRNCFKSSEQRRFERALLILSKTVYSNIVSRCFARIFVVFFCSYYRRQFWFNLVHKPKIKRMVKKKIKK